MGFWWLFSWQERLGQWLCTVLVRRLPKLGGCHRRCITGILYLVHSGLFFPPFFSFFFFFNTFCTPPQILRFSLLCLISCWRCLTKGQPLPRQWGWGCCCCFPGALFPPGALPVPLVPRPHARGGLGGPQRGCGAGVPGEGRSKHKAQAPRHGLLLWWLCAKELSH